MQTLSELRDFLRAPRDIVLTGHRNPDGDAIGSTIGLSRYLRALGHRTTVCVPSEYPRFLRFLDDVAEVLVYDAEEDRPATEAAVARADVIFLMDFNSLDRIDALGELVAAAPDNVKVLIDHHLFPDVEVDVAVSDTAASSTCELVYRVIKDMGDRALVTPQIAEPLMTGILTDTGGFTYAVRPALFREVAELFEVGVDHEKLHDAIFSGMSEKQLRLLGHALANRMELMPEYGAGLITLSKRDYEQFDIRRGDTEGIVNYLLRAEGIELAAFITEQPKITKVSLRSKGDVDVQQIAARYFKGGGHRNAAGGFSHQGLRAAVAKFKTALTERVAAAAGEGDRGRA